MRNLKKSLSLILALALLVSSVFVGGLTASAATELAKTTLTWDGVEFTDRDWDGQAGSDYNGNYMTLWNAQVTQDPLSSETNNTVHYVAAKAYNNKWPTAAKVYNDQSASLGFFAPKAKTTYEVKLRYYVDKVPSAQVNLQVRLTNSTMYGFVPVDAEFVCDEIVAVTDVTQGWVEASAKFSTPETLPRNCFIISASSTTTSSVSNVSIYIDDVTISECAPITAYNYDGENDKVVYASETTTLAELDMPTRDGYILTGIYSDAELTTKLNASDLALNYADTGVYYGWAKLNPGEYYVGFENYKTAVNGKSYDSATTSIVSGNTYAGGYNIKVNAAAGSLNAFELRDKAALETKAGTKYVISFQYRSTAAAKLYAGTAVASDVPGTATAIQGADLPAAADWTAASIEVTLNKGQNEGYVPVFMVQATDAATVEFDHIYLTYPVEETQNIENKFITSKDWYPSLAYFGGITIPEASAVWNGETELPSDADGDGIYEIDTAEKLAYVIKNGGSLTLDDSTVVENGSFILTKDIYLNDISKFDWSKFERLPWGQTILNEWYDTTTITAPFSGTIDGNHHSVYGVYTHYQWTATWAGYGKGRGLIPSVADGKVANIKNLNLDCVFVHNEVCGSGAFVGINYGTANFDSCTVGENVYVSGSYAGAFIGCNNDAEGGTINNCASYATLNGHNDAGTTDNLAGLVTNAWMNGGKVYINNSFNANGNITGDNSASFVAKNTFATVESGITAGITILTAEQMQGTKVLSIDGTMPALNVGGNYWTATEDYPVLSASRGIEVVEIDVWDGSTVAPTKTDDDGYILISTPEELAYVVSSGKMQNNYRLTNNIFLNDVNLIDWETGKVASGYTVNSWYKNKITATADNAETTDVVESTVIDGNGYTVYGLYYDDASVAEGKTNAFATARYNYVGLFPCIAKNTHVTVNKLGVDYSFINYYATASPFFGCIGENGGSNYVTVDQCYVGADVNINGGSAGAFIGYVCGGSCRLTIKNSYSQGHILNNNAYGNNGFTGNTWGLAFYTTTTDAENATVLAEKYGYYNSYNIEGSISRAGYNSGMRTYKSYGNNYATGYSYESSAGWHTIRTTDNMQGLDALTASTKMPNLNVDAATSAATTMYTATEGYPVLTAFVGKFYKAPEVKDNIVIGGGNNEESEISIWDGTSVAPTVGVGTEDNPWKIYTGAELYYVVKNQGGDGVYYQLQNDIYLNDITKVNWHTGSIADGYTVHKWISGGSAVFNGHIDGNGYGVYGIYIHDGKTNYSSTPSYATGLIPRTTAGGNVSVKNIEVDYMFSRYDSITGPIIGSVHSADTTIENCFVGQNVYGDSSYVGNLVGYVYGSDITLNVKNCYSLSSGHANTGHYAFLGYTHWTYVPNINLVNCYNAGGRMISENRSPFTATNCYEAVDGGLNAGVTTISKENMKGEDVLMNAAKMAGLKMASAYIKNDADFATANANNFVYLPAGTILEEDFAPLFFDNRMAPLDADKVLFVDRMIRGAYVKFEREVDVTKIHVPVSKAHRVAFGTAQDLLAAGYYDLETEVISENLADQPDTAVNYIFITDPHFDTGGDVGPISPQHSAKQYALAIQMANEMEEIDFVALGGDLTNGGYGSSEAWITALNGYLAETANCTKPVFILVGNHDDNAYGSISDSVTHADFSAKIISPDEWQSTIIDQFVNRTLADGTEIKVSQNVDPYDNTKVNSKYYYYDLDNKNTRVICLNASDYEYAYDANGNFTLVNNTSTSANVRSNTYNGYNFWGYSKYQMKWLAEEALGTLPENYNVIVLSHMAITADRNGQTYVNGTVLSDIMGAYQNKTAYTHDGYGISADFTADTGRIMAYQHGHEHVVYDKYNADCDVWQFSSANPNPHGSLATVMNENVASTDVMSATEGYVYKQALGKGDSGMYINNFPVYDNDINLDTIVDICDLVQLDNLELAALPAAQAANTTLEKIRKILIGA